MHTIATTPWRRSVTFDILCLIDFPNFVQSSDIEFLEIITAVRIKLATVSSFGIFALWVDLEIGVVEVDKDAV
jgi:hypothetical protein